MAEQNPQAGTQVASDQQPAAPVPQAGGPVQHVPQPTTMIRPPATAEETRPAPPSDDSNPHARITALRQQADEIEAALGGPATVKVKVELPHESILFGGMHVGNDFTAVPMNRLADLEMAAANAGATLTTEG